MKKNIQLLISAEFAEREIPANDSVRLIDEIIDEMDLSELYRAYSRLGRKPATEPSTLLKILIYGYMDRRYSSRDIEKACKRDMNYIWLLNEQKAPNHNEIARFRSGRLESCIDSLFYQFVMKLKEMGEIQFSHLFVDGTKIEANANKYSFVWQKSTTKYESKASDKILALINELNSKYMLNCNDSDELLTELKLRVTAPFVYGRGKRKTELQRDIESVEALALKLSKYKNYQNTFADRNSFSKTDCDATFMRLKEDHMQNAQLKPAYNLQLAVENEYITGLQLSSERNDQLTLIPLLEDLKQKGIVYEDVTADAGYESEEIYTYFENNTTNCYIKPQNYERSKTRKFKSNMALRENMQYDSRLDEYTCQNGKKLIATYTGTRKSKSGFESQVTYYECEGCEGCRHKKSCTKSKGNRKMQVSKKFVEQRELSLKNITSPMGVLLRTNRSIQVEGAFGVLKQDYEFRQFLLRGKKKVTVETLLFAFAFNANKYYAKRENNRLGSQLFGKISA